jgi:hypothetical protein
MAFEMIFAGLRNKFTAKITANADRFPIAIIRLIYVVGRLTRNIYELILPKIRFKISEFLDYLKMLAYLENTFRDFDGVQNA